MALETCFVKYDWYQTEGQVFIVLSKRNQSVEDCRIDFSPFSPSASSKQSIQVFAKDEVVFQTQLYGQVQPNKATIQVTPFKIEVRLDKTSNERWATLSVEDTSSSTTAVAQSESQTTNKGDVQLPKKKQPNWDKMGKDAEEEELENSDPSTKLFKKIYAGSDDETRRAMLKSMQESNGTVLNTNWAEVGKKKITPYKSKDSEEEGQDGQDD